MHRGVRLCTLIALVLHVACAVLAGDKPVRFFGSNGGVLLAPGEYDPAVPSPEQQLHFALGERPARHAAVLEYFRTLAAASRRVRLTTMGKTFEDRPLVYLVISDEKNIARCFELTG